VTICDLGLNGTAYALIVTNITNYLAINVYISSCKDLKESWFMPDWSTLRGINEYLKLGIPSTAMICLEWWSFEVMILIAGYISV
jgi:MATE family multidrug resistance protein